MKVGIITLHHNNYNYGAALQAFALQKALEGLGHKVDIIDYDRCAQPIEIVEDALGKKILRKIVNVRHVGDVINMAMIPFSKLVGEKYSEELNKRKKKFEEFYLKKMSISQYYNAATIGIANNCYDIFVCGSDQIWRPSSYDSNYYLAFADKSKVRISYAASMGVCGLSEREKAWLIPHISTLDAISVREKDIQKLLQPHVEKEVKCVLDPTLLWDADFWNKHCTMPVGIENKKYIFSYLIGEDNYNREIVQKLAKKLELPIITIPGISRVQPYDFMYADRNCISVGPEEFLGLIQNARMVITDSFHACVFSIIFRTRFYALERFVATDKNSMNGRIYNLLEMFSLEKHLLLRNMDLNTLDLCEEINPSYQKYNTILKESQNYLQEHVNKTVFSRDNQLYKLPHVYACQCKDAMIRRNSSSGGIFYSIAKNVIESQGHVIACKMNEYGEAVHAECKALQDIPLFMGSKYVQSRIGEMYQQAINILKNEEQLMFVGTPCQIEGLLSLLEVKGISRERLIAVDFVCHGVPSPLVWKKYLEEVTCKKEHTDISYSFRDKSKGWKNFSLRIKGKKIRYCKDKEEDDYLKGFLNNIFLRPSCYECKNKSINHNSDVTLADFWHFENVNTSITDDDSGISLVMIHSGRGDEIIRQLTDSGVIESDEVSCEVVAKVNKNMLIPARWNPKRMDFFTVNQELSMHARIGKALNETKLKRVLRKGKRFVKSIIRRR